MIASDIRHGSQTNSSDAWVLIVLGKRFHQSYPDLLASCEIGERSQYVQAMQRLKAASQKAHMIGLLKHCCVSHLMRHSLKCSQVYSNGLPFISTVSPS